MTDHAFPNLPRDVSDQVMDAARAASDQLELEQARRVRRTVQAWRDALLEHDADEPEHDEYRDGRVDAYQKVLDLFAGWPVSGR